jgi:hypothetical protein
MPAVSLGSAPNAGAHREPLRRALSISPEPQHRGDAVEHFVRLRRSHRGVSFPYTIKSLAALSGRAHAAVQTFHAARQAIPATMSLQPPGTQRLPREL